MPPRTIHFFADTNLFVQCRSLDELDWTLVAGEATEIYIVVSKPVQKEIDDHWRHRTDEQQFGCEFGRTLERDNVSGLLVCRIEAENLSDAKELKVPVRFRVRRESCLSIARALIADPTAIK